MAATLPKLKNADGIPLLKGKVIAYKNKTIQLSIPGSQYKLEVPAPAGETVETGDYVTGVLRVQSQRIDTVQTGGRFVEPCYGRPRRIQGKIVGGNASKNEIYVFASVPFAVRPMSPQTAVDFRIGDLVMFDITSDMTFVLSEAQAKELQD